MDIIWNYTGLEVLENDLSSYLEECQGLQPPSSPADCNPSFRTLWDETYLYFFFSVDDDTLVKTPPLLPYMDDDIELFIDSDFSHGKSYDFIDDFNIQFGWNYSEAAVSLSYSSEIDIAKFEFVQKTTGTGWNLELAIPMENLLMNTSSGHVFGLDVQYTDNDGNPCPNGGSQHPQREHKLSWWNVGNDSSWRNPSLFAKVMLGPEISTADIDLSVPGHDFGNVHLGETGSFGVTVGNPGLDTLRISDVRSESDEFTAGPQILEIAPGQNDEIAVQFHPGETVLCSDTLYIVSNAFGKPVIPFWVHGTGIYPEVESITVLPNPFTPNGDGYNDAVSFEYPDMYTLHPHIQIFDLKGARVRDMARFSGPEYLWDGKDDQGTNLDPGVYIYILEAKTRVVAKGTVTLIR
ncbi:gliding motility-associated C-terminal domain-containing protein [bacterium]|nr:gliding motility-associated C-terminal domain-containing protein [bacterium]